MATETRRGGTYVMNNESFGRMMVSERMRRPLVAVSKLIALEAKRNTEQSSAGGPPHDPKEGKTLAESYKTGPGPIVVVKGQTGIPGPRISHRVINPKRYAAAREFGHGRPQASLKGLRGNARKRVAAADVAGPNTGTMGTRDLRRAGEKFNDGIEGAA